MSKPNPSYYAVLTADVRYDNDLPPNAKLLFAEITALSNTTGICTASNAWLAKLYDVKPKTVSEWVGLLAAKGYIQVNVLADLGNKREIAIPKIPDTYPENTGYPYPENTGHNNTSNNTKPPTPSTDLDPDIVKCYDLYLKYFIIPRLETHDTDIYKMSSPEKRAAAEKIEASKRYKLTPGRKDKLRIRLSDAKFKMVAAAIVGYGRADWSNGNNDRRWMADLGTFICHNYENVERGARLYEDQRKRPDGDDAWSKL